MALPVQFLKSVETPGEKFGSGLSQGLQALANMQLGELQQRRQTQRGSQFWQSLGLPPETAMQFAAAPEAVQKSLLDRLEGLGIPGMQPDQQVQPTGIPTEQPIQPAEPSGLRIGASPLERRHRETLAQQERIAIDKLVAPQLSKIEEKSETPKRVVNLSREALDLLKTGKAKTGLLGKITPDYLQSSQGQELISKLKQIVLARAQLGKGVPSRMRLILEEGAKAQIWQQPEAIQKILESNIEDQEFQKSIAMDEAREEVMQEYGENLPRNTKAIVEKRARDILKRRKEEAIDLPSVDEFSDDAIIEIGDKQYEKKSGKWVPVGE